MFDVERDCYFSPECSESGVGRGKKESGEDLEGESVTVLLGSIPQLFAISNQFCNDSTYFWMSSVSGFIPLVGWGDDTLVCVCVCVCVSGQIPPLVT